MGFFDFLKGKNKTNEAFSKSDTLSPKGSADTGHITDADGNVYNTVKIGTQIWMTENLKTTKYNDGTAIPLVINVGWYYRETPGYCWYDNDINYKNKYGALYNWHAVNTKKLAPIGWHVPTQAECDILEDYLRANGYEQGGYIAKSLAAQTDWIMEYGMDEETIGKKLESNNKSGFSALPGGWRVYTANSFHDMGSEGYWWCSAEDGALVASYFCLKYNHTYFGQGNFSLEADFVRLSNGYSVRLLRD